MPDIFRKLLTDPKVVAALAASIAIFLRTQIPFLKDLTDEQVRDVLILAGGWLFGESIRSFRLFGDGLPWWKQLISSSRFQAVVASIAVVVLREKIPILKDVTDEQVMWFVSMVAVWIAGESKQSFKIPLNQQVAK